MPDTAQPTAEIGITGLAVMGANLARNLARHGYPTAIHNRTNSKTDDLVTHHGHEGTFVPSHSAADFVASLRTPRVIISMVKAGPGTDAVIDTLAPLLERGDVLVDGGNALFTDTERRTAALAERGIDFVGMGVSGGEEGALLGPSIMPGGSVHAWEVLGPKLETIAAQVDGTPCTVHVGPGGAGHYVKMVHNGVEYGLMQAYAEGFNLFDSCEYQLDNARIAHLWMNASVVRSWLCELAARAFEMEDNDLSGLEPVVADSGEGRWTVEDAVDKRVPMPVIASSLFARYETQGHGDFAAKVNAALRAQFGGHAVERAADG